MRGSAFAAFPVRPCAEFTGAAHNEQAIHILRVPGRARFVVFILHNVTILTERHNETPPAGHPNVSAGGAAKNIRCKDDRR